MKVCRIRVILPILLVAVFLLVASPALAQVPTGQCNGPDSEQGTFAVTPSSGPAGTSALITGSFQVQPAENALVDGGLVQDTVQEGPDVEASWYDTGAGLGGFEITIDENLIAHFSGNVTIPADAPPGPHEIALLIAGLSDPNCVTFTVTQTVQQDAYPTVATLAGTGVDIAGLALLAVIPAGGYWLARRLRFR